MRLSVHADHHCFPSALELVLARDCSVGIIPPGTAGERLGEAERCHSRTILAISSASSVENGEQNASISRRWISLSRMRRAKQGVFSQSRENVLAAIETRVSSERRVTEKEERTM